jgi:hypothetical protein
MLPYNHPFLHQSITGAVITILNSTKTNLAINPFLNPYFAVFGLINCKAVAGGIVA